MLFILQSMTTFAEETEYSRNIREARAVLEQVFQCEEKQKYDRCYDLLSSSFRRALQQESDIKNRDQYKKMREFQGLRWHSPTITGDPFSHQSSVSFTVDISYEQLITGDITATGRIEIVAVMFKESGRWLLERWGRMATD
jgi:hypothetical protein